MCTTSLDHCVGFSSFFVVCLSTTKKVNQPSKMWGKYSPIDIQRQLKCMNTQNDKNHCEFWIWMNNVNMSCSACSTVSYRFQDKSSWSEISGTFFRFPELSLTFTSPLPLDDAKNSPLKILLLAPEKVVTLLTLTYEARSTSTGWRRWTKKPKNKKGFDRKSNSKGIQIH